MGERVPSLVMQADAGLSCCVVSGSRALMLTPFWAVMQAGEGPVLNLYFPGKVEAKTASGGKVRRRNGNRLSSAGSGADDGQAGPAARRSPSACESPPGVGRPCSR